MSRRCLLLCLFLPFATLASGLPSAALTRHQAPASLSPADTLHLSAADTLVAMGSVFCLPVYSTGGFDSLVALQFSLHWDTSVIQFDAIAGFNPKLGLDLGNFNVTQTAAGYLALAWDTGAPAGVSLPDSAVLFRVCFLTVGAPGDSTPVLFSDFPLPPEAYNLPLIELIPVALDTGSVVILTIDPCAGFTAQATATPAHCGHADGTISLSHGGVGPFVYYWADLPGSSALQNRAPLAPGIYSVTVTDSKGCTASASATVEDQGGPTAAALSKSATCGQANGELNLAPAGGAPPLQFVWITGDTTEDLIDLPVGTYTVTITDAAGCTLVASFPVFGPAPLQASNVLEDCMGTNTTFSVSCTLAGGTPPFTVASGSGSFIGNQFTSAPLPTGTAYSFTFKDSTGCPFVLNGAHTCPCLTKAGTMGKTLITICGSGAATAQFNQDQALPPGVVLLFALHQGNGTALGTPIAWNAQPVFSFLPGMNYGDTYYISAVAGQTDVSGNIILTDPCLSVAAGQPVRFLKSLIVNLSETICAGDVYKVGNQALTQSGFYTIPITTASGCDSIVNIALDVRQPLLSLGPDQSICAGSTAQLNAQISGCSGCQYAWSAAGLSGSVASVKPAATTTYTVTITDNAGCTAENNVKVRVIPATTTHLDVAICKGTSYTVGNQIFTQSGQFTVKLASSAGCDSTVVLKLTLLDAQLYPARADTFFLPPGAGTTPFPFKVTANDGVSSPDGWITRLLSSPSAGSAQLDSSGQLLYRLQNTAFQGLDSFSYELCDRNCLGACTQATVWVVVQNGLQVLPDQLPNALTPNGDGVNDTFDPLRPLLDEHYIVPYSRSSLTILNRWGEIVFHAQPYPDGGWDGRTDAGGLLPQGAYYYLLRLDLGEMQEVKGVVYVLEARE